jgi:hypothetical protein
METYIQVLFWLNIACLAIKMMLICSVDYPRTKKETLGEKVFLILLGTAFTVWAGFLLFLINKHRLN